MSNGFIYLAAPYSAGGADDALMLKRFWQITAQAAILEEDGFIVYSPITSGRPLEACGLDFDHDQWLERDKTFVEKALSLYVMCLPGWGESEGVKREVAWALEREKAVFHFEPDYEKIQERLEAADPLKLLVTDPFIPFAEQRQVLQA